MCVFDTVFDVIKGVELIQKLRTCGNKLYLNRVLTACTFG